MRRRWGQSGAWLAVNSGWRGACWGLGEWESVVLCPESVVRWRGATVPRGPSARPSAVGARLPAGGGPVSSPLAGAFLALCLELKQAAVAMSLLLFFLYKPIRFWVFFWR